MSELVGVLGPAALAQQLDGQIRDAYGQAEDCAQRAKTDDLRERHHWFVLERRWLTLARSIEYARRPERS